ncbi:Angiotensin-converting enzyme, partial [Pseudolycoriella hygida]
KMWSLTILPFVVLLANLANGQITEIEMIQRLKTYDEQVSFYCKQQVLANWDVQTDVGNKTKEELAATIEYANFRKEQYNQYFRNASIESYNDPDVRRQLMLLKNIGTAALSDADLDSLTRIRTSMSGIYSSAKICPYERPVCDLETEGLSLDPQIEERLATLAKSGDNYNEMLYLWEEWREKSGKLMRDQYKEYVALSNKAAVANGFKDNGEMWRARYEHNNLVELVDKLWSEVEPLYHELHRFVRHRLSDVYSMVNIGDPLLPAHVFGNMAQNWGHLYELTRPFPNASDVDVTSKMIDLEFDEYRMYNMSDEFYMSLGLPTSFVSYNPPSIIVKPTDRTITCHASAWDFCDGEDFRIKQCTKINMEDFLVVHHEMGHIMYYLMYKDQPQIYRTGANPGFHEAVGDTIALSVATPKHLAAVGLLENYADSEADNINALYKMALERVAFLPFGLLIDKWRWDVFDGTTPESQWNQHWWELREKYQKIKAPTFRGEEFFDPGAKYHIPADSQYIAYFVAHILEFSFYRSLCIAAGEYDPNNSTSQLHKCDYYNSEAAGNKLRAGLSLGYSKHWSEALQELTGSPEISSSALMEYFAPLYDFLKAENDKRLKEDVPALLDQYNEAASRMCNILTVAEWNLASNSKDEELDLEYEEAVLENAKFDQEWHQIFKDANPDDFSDELIKRQIKAFHLGGNPLPTDELIVLTSTQTHMVNTYNEARICPFANQNCNMSNWDVSLSLDPEIAEVMATSTDYDELKWVWEQWHDKSGKGMRNEFVTYVNLSNKAAQLNNVSDAGKMWLRAYEDDDFVSKVDAAWAEVEPFYNELHTYVRRKLKEIYGDKMDDSDNLIPAHILGNM